MANEDFPDPCEYCPMSYFANNIHDCRKDCEELKEASRQWAKEQKEENE